jgi:hypothetical protein
MRILPDDNNLLLIIDLQNDLTECFQKLPKYTDFDE